MRHTPGWDFYDVAVTGSFPRNDMPKLRVKREAPIRLVRIFAQWPSSSPPLAVALRPEGVGVAEVALPAPARSMARLLVAVCPSGTGQADGPLSPIARSPLNAADGPGKSLLASAAAAAADAEADDLEAQQLYTRQQLLYTRLRRSSGGGNRNSDGSSTARPSQGSSAVSGGSEARPSRSRKSLPASLADAAAEAALEEARGHDRVSTGKRQTGKLGSVLAAAEEAAKEPMTGGNQELHPASAPEGHTDAVAKEAPAVPVREPPAPKPSRRRTSVGLEANAKSVAAETPPVSPSVSSTAKVRQQKPLSVLEAVASAVAAEASSAENEAAKPGLNAALTGLQAALGGSSPQLGASGSPKKDVTDPTAPSPLSARPHRTKRASTVRIFEDEPEMLATDQEDAGTNASLREEISRLRAEVEQHSFAREAAEAGAKKMREERDELLQKLRCAERAQMTSDMQVRTLTNALAESQRLNDLLQGEDKNSSATPSSLEDVVKTLVTFELEALRNGSQEERAAEKRRLLLRWHPDKNGASGAGGADLATRVMQEMQKRGEWNDKV